MTDLDRLLELARKATPGPWQGNDEQVYNPDHWFQTSDGDYDKGAVVAAKFDTKADAEYIAAASPDTIIALIERVKLAEARVKEAEREAEKWKQSSEGWQRAYEKG